MARLFRLPVCVEERSSDADVRMGGACSSQPFAHTKRVYRCETGAPRPSNEGFDIRQTPNVVLDGGSLSPPGCSG
jgi:hypothetical protein